MMLPNKPSKFLIIGSVAMHHWASMDNHESRTPGDLDIMSKELPFVPSPKPSRLLLENSWFGEASEYMMEKNNDRVFLDLDFCYTLKMSHACYNIKLTKTLSDIKIMTKLGACIDHQLYDMLREHWKTVHGDNIKFSMNVSTDSFFSSDAVNRLYKHDDIHAACAYPKEPAYKMFLKSSDSPMFDMKKFEDAPYAHKMQAVMEEMVVIAIERYLVHQKTPLKKSDKLLALSKAYQQLVTTMTTGQFNFFLLYSINEIQHNHLTMVYLIDKTLKGLNHGKI